MRSITTRTTSPTGTTVTTGPVVSATYPLGYFREDYEFIAHPGSEDYLDVHNGRFCVTPEYPNGTYAYFATVNQNWNSAYPYVVGPTFYGIVAATKVTSITEPVTAYVPSPTAVESLLSEEQITVYPNPASDLVAVQLNALNRQHLKVELIDMTGKAVLQSRINQGSTIAFFDIRTLYSGHYVLRISDELHSPVNKIMLVSH